MRRRPGRGRLLLLVFLALSILIITLDFRQGSGGPLERAKDVSSAIVRPIQRGLTAVFRPVGDFFSALGEMSDLRAENERLEELVDELESQVARAEAVEDENVRLREFLEIDEPWFEAEKVTAQQIGRVPVNWKWAITIDKGTDDGIEPEMPVVNTDGLVGTVVRAEANTAIVLMLIDPLVAASARVQGTFDTGLVEGNGTDDELTMRIVDSGASVSVGSKVVTAPSLGGIYPPGIPIGTVSHVGGDERQVEQQLEVNPHVDFTSLDYVQVLLEHPPATANPFEDRDRNRGDR
jgi:rod shape-determining protein MreC